MSDVSELGINNTVYDINSKSITDQNGGKLRFWTGTRTQYDAIVQKVNDTIYNLTDTGQIYKGTELIADKTKLYTTVGQNTDGAMTQKAITDEIYYKSGDTFENTSYCVYPAYVTSSGTSVRIGITTPKRLDNITSVTCNSLIVGFRKSTGGYAPSTPWDAKANATSITCDIGASNLMYIWVYYDNYGFTNNTPVGCEIRSFSFTFT